MAGKYQWPADRLTEKEMAILYKLREETHKPINQLLQEIIITAGNPRLVTKHIIQTWDAEDLWDLHLKLANEIAEAVTQTNKFLLIGSAPYIKNWYKKRGQILTAHGYKLCAINNAWAVDPDNIYLWMYPCDFFDTGHLFPSEEQRGEWQEYICDHRKPVKGKYDYVREGSGTMLLNALVYLLNQSIEDGRKCKILVAGSDCVYKKGESHFYGKGEADPLRYGKEWLISELNRIKTFYEEEGCEIYNVGGRKKTLLPFKRKKIGRG